jgi:hypothetical protein
VGEQGQGLPTPPATTVRLGKAGYAINAGEEFSFGRATSCTVCLDPNDLGISRVAGSIEADGGTWWVVNRSTTRPLAVVDEIGFRSVLPPGRRYAIEGQVRLVVDGSFGSHALDISSPARTALADLPLDGERTIVGENVLINPYDRAALTALLAGYLEDGPRYDPHPKSYQAAGARLGLPPSTVRKRIEYLRSRLDKAGVPNMTGWNALPSLAEYVLTTGIITKEDLRLIRR